MSGRKYLLRTIQPPPSSQHRPCSRSEPPGNAGPSLQLTQSGGLLPKPSQLHFSLAEGCWILAFSSGAGQGLAGWFSHHGGCWLTQRKSDFRERQNDPEANERLCIIGENDFGCQSLCSRLRPLFTPCMSRPGSSEIALRLFPLFLKLGS